MRSVSPIIMWLGLSLAAVCLLPFGLSTYQITTSRDRLIDQSQRTHLMAARTAAERLGARKDSLQGLLGTLGNIPDLYVRPDAEAARDLLRSAVESEPGILSLGLVATRDGQPPQRVVEIRTEAAPASLDLLSFVDEPLSFHADDDGRMLTVATVESARPGVFLVAAQEDATLPSILNPEELGSAADLFVVDGAGQPLLAPAGLTELPDTLIELLTVGGIQSAGQKIDWPDIGASISAFARVQESPFAVISRQPVLAADTLSRDLRRTAWTIFIAVSALALGVLAMFSTKVVQPIRRLVAQQRELAGLKPGELRSGGEIAELNEAFEAIKRSETDREALSEVFVDRYQVLRVIGTGGMGSVYLGMDPKLRRHVALKTLNFEYLNGPERDNAFRHLREEAVVAARLAHRNVVAIHDIIEGPRGAFVAMELVDGQSLSTVLLDIDRLTMTQTMPIIVAVLRGLIAAHEKGMVHRDIKPANVLIGTNGDIKVTDFGTAAPVSAGEKTRSQVVGTPGYIAPESIISGTFSEKSDVFAVGVLTVRCLTGEMPFKANSAEQVFARTTQNAIDFSRGPLAELTWPVSKAIQAMLERDPAFRATATDALAGLLEAWDSPVRWDNDWFNIRSILERKEAPDERPTERLFGTAAA